MTKANRFAKAGEELLTRAGEKIQVPEDVTLDDAIVYLGKVRDSAEQVVSLMEKIKGAAWDVAHAIGQAMRRQFGIVESLKGFFGTPPQIYRIPSGVNSHVEVPWGEFRVPGVEGKFSIGFDSEDSTVYLAASIKRKDEGKFRKLVELARKIREEESIYKGKALRATAAQLDGSGEGIQFLDVRSADPAKLILSAPIRRAVETSVFTPIRYSARCRQLGIPTKRGVLFAGRYGTGKTLAAFVAAKMCEDSGRTFVYIESAEDLQAAMRFASMYQPALVFCEDIDRVTSGERDADLDAILNTIDGVDTKDNDVMLVLTSNNPGAINRAMIRPGRLDDVIEFQPPDAAAVEELIRLYAGKMLDDKSDISEACGKLAGQIPAVIRECVERSKLSAVKVTNGDSGPLSIGGGMLLDAIDTMSAQLAMLSEEPKGLGPYEALGQLLAAVAQSRRGVEDVRVQISGTPSADVSILECGECGESVKAYSRAELVD